MECPACGATRIRFSVPAAVHHLFAERIETTSICTSCLVLTASDEAEKSPDFDRVIQGFPAGDAGVAMALAVGLLVDSVALHRADIDALFEFVQESGNDPRLVIERLAAAGTISPPIDLERALRQFDQLTT